MAKKLIDQDEAARMLGVTVEELNVLRDRQEVYGYRDAGSWKYKSDELERYLQSRKSDGEESWLSGSDLEDVPLELNEDADSILLSEVELGQSPDTTQSTIIGAPGANVSPEDSDVQLAKPALPADGGGSDVHLVADSSSDVKLVAGGSDVLGGAKAPGKFDDLESLQLGDSGLALAGSEIMAGEGLSLDDNLPAASSGSDKAGGSELNLADSEDDLVLGASGSDLTLGAGDSGISLVDPADSGLSLEEAPVDLSAGGSGVELLELGEADVISLDDEADFDAATQLKQEDDFLLTPLDDAAADQSDSGSQVIALDSEDEFSSAGNMFADESGSGSMLEEDLASSSPLVAAMPGSLGPAVTSATPPGAPVGAYSPAVSFSMGSVVFLGCTAALLAVCGMMTFDLMRNMWSWEQPYSLSSSIMDGLVGLFE